MLVEVGFVCGELCFADMAAKVTVASAVKFQLKPFQAYQKLRRNQISFSPIK